MSFDSQDDDLLGGTDLYTAKETIVAHMQNHLDQLRAGFFDGIISPAITFKLIELAEMELKCFLDITLDDNMSPQAMLARYHACVNEEYDTLLALREAEKQQSDWPN